MKRITQLFFILFGMVPALLNGQQLERSVIAAAGDQLDTNAYSISFTFGEVVVGDLASGNTISQGFHQVWAIVTSSDDPSAFVYNISVYPNPTVGEIRIDNETALTLQLHDGAGKLLQTASIEAGRNEMNIASLPVGMYWLTAHQEGAGNTRTFRVMKVE